MNSNMEETTTLPLNISDVNKPMIFTNRLHMLLHSIALCFLFYYRLCYFFQSRATPPLLLPWILVFLSEIILSFIWILGQAYRWNPISRTVFPQRLPEDQKLPHIDVFICTADPTKEPTIDVMNILLSAMALDYPPDKLHLYVSDDGGSAVTLNGMRVAWKFARWWIPFCTRYRIRCRCPKAYFSSQESDDDFGGDMEFVAHRKMIKEKYEVFKEDMLRFREDEVHSGDATGITSQNHASIIEVCFWQVIQEDSRDEIEPVNLPSLVYVSREKKPSHPHHFKAGALNALYRISAVMSNSPYILVLDCDMFCSEPDSVRQALCFHLDPKLSPSLAYVQFPQKFHNISKNDIYDSQHRSAYKVLWQGMDGLKGPVLSGTGFYMKREALYGNYTIKGTELEPQQQFGASNKLIKSLKQQNFTPDLMNDGKALPDEETLLLASCNYETNTKWGQEIGFLYGTVCEDVHTGFMLNCNGWNSVFCDPSKPQFLGNSTTNLNELLIQGTRWGSGLLDIGSSRFCPLIYGPLRMSLLQSLCVAELTYFPLYCLPLWCFAIVPQLCLLYGFSLCPKVSDPFFFIFLFIFLSSLTKHLVEVLTTGGTFRKWIIEQRIWMMKSVTCHFYGLLDATLKKLGLREGSFMPTNKVEDHEQTMLYQMDKYDFRTSKMFLVPMVAIIIFNMSCFFGGIYRVASVGNWNSMFMQLLLPCYVIVVNYPIIEGLIRKDKGSISTSVIILSNFLVIIIHFILSPLLI
ncbi:cellulose synthase-like protein G2 isoform X1 [Arachis hypogaea]|uniref:cellulose synthase-like protein G2 isoform X1 n=1 Tax=Arachis hypogaea TaxID=3818 RepID=UPI000DED1C03|nr:cellulose synthase-like protein G2 isoform X1 [Arachis hypogaea]